MAFSGTSGAYYRANSPSTTADGALYNAYTRHLFVRASAAPSTANFRFVAGLVGTLIAQNPQAQLAWNHTSSTFLGSNYNRRSGGSYDAAKMTTANLTADTWHSIAGSLDGSTIKSYLNGVEDGSAASAAGSSSGFVYFDALAGITTAGALDSSSQFDIGQVAEYAVWNVALTADEIASLAKGFRASRIRPQSLVFYAPMIRERVEIKGGKTWNLQGGSEVISDHPRVIG